MLSHGLSQFMQLHYLDKSPIFHFLDPLFREARKYTTYLN